MRPCQYVKPVRLICLVGPEDRNVRSVERCLGMTSTRTRMTCNLGHVQSKRPRFRIRRGHRAQFMQVPESQPERFDAQPSSRGQFR